MKVLIDRDPFVTPDPDATFGFTAWPAFWVHLPAAGAPPFVLAYRCRFESDTDDTMRLHVSADERYELFLDGQRIGRGPERGTPRCWFFDTYDLRITPGPHVLVARVWTLGAADNLAPLAQMSVHPGLIVAAEGAWNAKVGTGVAGWQAKKIGGYSFTGPGAFGIIPFMGAAERVDAATFDFGFERGKGEGWQDITKRSPGRAGSHPWGEVAGEPSLAPAMLPAQLDVPRHVGEVRSAVRLSADTDLKTHPVRADEHDPALASRANAMLRGEGPLEIEPHTRLRLVIDLGEYYCAYPELVTSGGNGAHLQLHWAEGLYVAPKRGGHKGNRDQIEGKYFLGFGDDWLPDGGPGRTFRPLWWRCGRYLQLLIETADQPLTIDNLTLWETRYPFEPQTKFDCDEPRLLRSTPILVRGMQMCMHETYFDCPYYEQLMYTGDTRLEVLTTYALTNDDRLPRKAVRMYEASRMPNGLTQARFPCRGTQSIPPFALWWVCMVHDYAMWRGDRPFIARMLPGARGVLDYYRGLMDERGLVGPADGWNFVDWEDDWQRRWSGAPPEAAGGFSCPINWQVVLALSAKAELERWLGEDALAERDEVAARRLVDAIIRAFWSPERGMFADDLAHTRFSEHSQCLAILSGMLDEHHREAAARALFTVDDLARTTIYFSHYLLETCRVLGRMDRFFARLEEWYALPDLGLRTPIEQPEPSRSDCHAWGSHPLFHLRATVLGIRPAAPGFAEAVITPQLGPLQRASGTLPHPRGEISAAFEQRDGRIVGEVRLPGGVGGEVRANGQRYRIEGGRCEVA